MEYLYGHHLFTQKISNCSARGDNRPCTEKERQMTTNDHGDGLGARFDPESYLLGLLDAKIECDAARSVMRSVYENDKLRFSGAIEAIRQAIILIEDKMAMMEAPNVRAKLRQAITLNRD